MSENLPAAIDPAKVGAIVEAVIVRGDLENLTPQQRTTYYNEVCTSMGLNPLTRPLDFIKLNGKLTLYALKNATDQLRRIYGVSITDVTQERVDDLLVVTAKARDQGGRTDISKGALVLKGLTGENLANAIMKCETKAKRRVTLSICGMGFLDETEVETISNAHTVRLPKKDARKLYGDLEHEVDEAADIDDWLIKNEGRLLVLPADWENIIRLRIDEKKARPATIEEPTVLMDDEDQTPPEWGGSKWDALGPVKQAGVLCNQQAFCTFLTETWPTKVAATAADFVRSHCGVQSRKELATNPEAARLWRVLVEEYRLWQREPGVINHPVVDQSQIAGSQQMGPSRLPLRSSGPNSGFDSRDGGQVAPRQPDDRADNPAAPVIPPAGAADVPTAQAYTERWQTIIDGATPSRRAQIARAWNDDNALRGQIQWTDAHPFSKLKKRVADALEFLKEGAA